MGSIKNFEALVPTLKQIIQKQLKPVYLGDKYLMFYNIVLNKFCLRSYFDHISERLKNVYIQI